MRLDDKLRIYLDERDIRPSITKIAVATAMDTLKEATIKQINKEAARMCGKRHLDYKTVSGVLGMMMDAGWVDSIRPNERRGHGPEKHGRPIVYFIKEQADDGPNP